MVTAWLQRTFLTRLSLDLARPVRRSLAWRIGYFVGELFLKGRGDASTRGDRGQVPQENLHHHPAIDADDLTGDVARGIAG